MVMRDEHIVLDCVGVGWDQFHQLRTVVEAARGLGRLPLLNRLDDYWEDADFQPNEIADLRSEVVEVSEVPAVRHDLRETLAKLVGLCDVAIRERKAIEVRAD